MTYAGRTHDPGRRQPRDGAGGLPRRLHRAGDRATGCGRAAWSARSPCSTTRSPRRAARAAHDPEVAAAWPRSGCSQDKGWFAMGGFDPTERSRVLDLLGFEGQLVFATFATSMFPGRDLGRLYAGSRRAEPRHARASATATHGCCRSASCPLVDPERAVAALRRGDRTRAARRSWCRRPRRASARRPTRTSTGSGTLLEAANVPFVLHVGGGGRLLDPAFHNNGMPVTDHLGGGENVRSKDFLAIHHSPEVFLGALILDGLFDRFPRLRGGCIEQGAGWVVSWLRHLDYAQRAFRRTEEPLRQPRGRAVGLRAPAPQVHAVPRRAGRLDDRAGRRGAVHVLDGLPASRGRSRPAGQVRGDRSPTSSEADQDALLLGQHGRAAARPARRGGRGGGIGGRPRRGAPRRRHQIEMTPARRRGRGARGSASRWRRHLDGDVRVRPHRAGCSPAMTRPKRDSSTGRARSSRIR